jgi:lysyl-tRNA synthetase class II
MVELGRIKNIRKAGKKLVFIDLMFNFKVTQLILNVKYMDAEKHSKLVNQMEVGDNYGDLNTHTEFVGFWGQSKSGQDSVFVVDGQLLSPCLRQIPLELKDVHTKYRYPFLNMLVNKNCVDNFRLRSKVFYYLIRLFRNCAHPCMKRDLKKSKHLFCPPNLEEL